MLEVQAQKTTQTEAIYSAPEIHTLLQKLYERRISPEVISTFQIEPNRQGWQYPTPFGGLRWKNANSKADVKYAWLGNPDKDGLYHAGDLQQAIDAAGGACWYASGEPDVWALRAAGIHHAFSSYSENAIPPMLVGWLYMFGVETLYIAPDKDKTGARWADKLATTLQDTGIDLVVRALPDDLGDSGDIGKAWQAYTKRQPFERYLLSLPTHAVTVQPPQIQTVVYTSDMGEVSAESKALICDRLGVTGWKSNGWARNLVSCPDKVHHTHGDKNPSMSIGKHGAKCLTSGNFYLWRDLAELLGLGKVTIETAYTSTLTAPVITAAGLSVEAQTEFISMGASSLARLLCVLFEQGRMGTDIVTKDAQAVCKGILSAHAVRRGLLQAEGRDLDKTGTAKMKSKRENGRIPFFGTLYHLFFSPNDVTKHKKKVGHRQSKLYHIPAPKEISEALGIQDKTYQVIAAGKVKSAPKYKAEIMAVMPRRKAGQYARKQLAQGLCHPNTTRSYAKLAGLKTTPVIKREDVTAERLESLKIELPKKLPNRPKIYKFFEVTPGGKQYQHTQAGLHEALKAARDGVIFECIREANHYE